MRLTQAEFKKLAKRPSFKMFLVDSSIMRSYLANSSIPSSHHSALTTSSSAQTPLDAQVRKLTCLTLSFTHSGVLKSCSQ
jgi:hypothetical protein